MSRTTTKQADQATALEYVRETLDGATREPQTGKIKVYVAITSVARSGMSRTMELYVIDHESRNLLTLTWNVGKALGYRVSDKGLHVTGCGMDMRFAVLDHLARHVGLDSGNDFDIRSIGG